MKKITAYLLLFLLFTGFFTATAQASRLTHIKDTISSSRPSLGADHEFIFTTSKAVPPSGKIEIVPEANKFNILTGFDYTDVDLAVWDDLSGDFVERPLFFIPTVADDGVMATLGFQGKVSITLNISEGIAAGEKVRLRLGTNAAFGETGDVQIQNPATSTSYRIVINTYDSSSKLLDYGEVSVYILEPVLMGSFMMKIRSNGAPSGNIAYGTTQTIMSMISNYQAICRFSTASGTPYYMMTDVFDFTGNYFHSTLLSGLASGDHTYYIRCRDNYNVDDDTDYIINFFIQGSGESESTGEGEDEGEGTGYESGGGSTGGGGGGGAGPVIGPGSGDLLPFPPLPGSPSVEISGWAYPSSNVYILKDGVESAKVIANSGADFTSALYDLKEGVYTFGVWAYDSLNRKSPTYSSTFWIKEGTKTVVSNIILSPTIQLETNTLNSGDKFKVFGQAVPSSDVEILLYPNKTNYTQDEIVSVKTRAAADGKWESTLDTTGLENGQYFVKARTVIPDKAVSLYGDAMRLGIGEKVVENVCAGADLNQDGRVNITDFSILLFWWNTDNACADQNKDKIVNLIDFSIMMYNWTG